MKREREPGDVVARADRGRAINRASWAAALVTLAVRLPFAASRLWDHDSIQFALGVERYDLAAHHPHPPGYPLYIGLLKLLAALGPLGPLQVDALHGMVALSILAGAMGAALMVPLTAELLALAEADARPGRPRRPRRSTAGAIPVPTRTQTAGDESAPGRAGLFAAALYTFNPLLWFYGELPLLYAVEGGVAVALAYGALRMAGGRAAFLVTCAGFALAGGLRQSTLVLMAPLFLLGVWRGFRRGRLPPGLLAAGGALAGAVVLAWLVPLCLAAGGWAAYRRIGAEHFRTLLPHTSILYGAGWGALAHNLTILLKWTLQGLVPAAAALAALGLAAPRALASGLRPLRGALPWLLAWALPPLLFFALVHVTKAGYTLIHLPALLAAASLAAAPALAGSRARAAAATLLAVGVGAALFLFGADRRPDQPRALAVVRHEFNRGAIASYEHDLDQLLATLRRYPAAATVLATVELSGTGVGAAEGFLYPWHRHLQWYLPEYEVLWLVPEEGFALVTRGHHPFVREDRTIVLPASTRQLILVLSGPTGDRLALPPGPLTRIGQTFHVLAVPFPGTLRLGPLLLTAERRRAA
ncbi:MAG TPA: hypothetical protein VHR45_05650 [Thermoanaerobaculia bacterium]|nr:hypothetical protein [Thermoanaerobaculia bacterium]